MGYTTNFVGSFKLSRKLTCAEVDEFNKFVLKRHDDGPSYYCQWIIKNNDEIAWDGGEKFYEFVEWLEVIYEKFLKAWGVSFIPGYVFFVGEDGSPSDSGIIAVDCDQIKCVTLKELAEHYMNS